MIECLWSGEHQAESRAGYIQKPERSSKSQENHDLSLLSPQITGFLSKPSKQKIQHRTVTGKENIQDDKCTLAEESKSSILSED